MKYVILSLCVLAAVALASNVDEDETALLSSFHHHAADFRSQFKQYMESRPTGRPKDVYKTIHNSFRDALKALHSQRPTGRPFANHKDRAAHNHATWTLHSNYRNAQSVLRKWVQQRNQEARAAAAAAKSDADETEIVSASFADHVKLFGDHFNSLLAQRPTGRPDFDGFKHMIEKKYKEAKDNLKAASGPSKHSKHGHEYKKAYDQLKKAKHELQKKLDAWKHSVNGEQKPQPHDHHKHDHHKHADPKKPKQEDVSQLSDKFLTALAQAQGFKAHFDNLLAQRPTGRPDFDGFKDMIEKKYKEAKDNLKAASGPGKHSKHGREYKKAYGQLKSQVHDVRGEVEDWQTKFEEEEMKAKIAASPFGTYLDGFKKHFDDAYNKRPTGRPHVPDFRKDLRKKYDEFKNNLKAAKPHKSASKDEKELFKQAYHMLKGHMEEAEEKVKAWEHQVKHAGHDHHKYDHHKHDHHKHDHHKQDQDDADETAVLSSSFASHVMDFRNHFGDMFSKRPTGRPDYNGLKKSLSTKYREIKDKLKAAGKAGTMTIEEKHDYEDALDELKEHRKDLKDKVDEWEVQEWSSKLAVSTFGPAVNGFKQYADSLLTQKPTSESEFEDLLDELEKKYEETKTNMKAMKPSLSASEEDKDLYDFGYEMLKDYMDDAEDKIEDWQEDFEAEQMKGKVVDSPFNAHLDDFKQHFDAAYGKRPTGAPALKKFMKDLKKKYDMVKGEMKSKKPGLKASEDEKDIYDSAYKMLKNHMDEAKDKIKAWRKKVEAGLTQEISQQDEDETEIISSPFLTHPESFRIDFAEFFNNRPTGRPDLKKLLTWLNLKYIVAKKNLILSRHTARMANGGRPITDEKKLLKDARKQLVGHRNDAEKKIKEWVKGLKRLDDDAGQALV